MKISILFQKKNYYNLIVGNYGTRKHRKIILIYKIIKKIIKFSRNHKNEVELYV